jgi:hypothetical protein
MRGAMMHWMRCLLGLLFCILLPLAGCDSDKDPSQPDYMVFVPDVEVRHGLDIPYDHRVTIVEAIIEAGGDGPTEDLRPDGELSPEKDEKEKPEEAKSDACVPDCTFEDGTEKECGPDGCGSICDYCKGSDECVDHICMPYCQPQCDGKDCGPDGCYGECPPGCDEGFICNLDDQKCYPFCDHDANCQGKECGPDLCDGVCGVCGKGLLCDEEAGKCEPDPCAEVPPGIGKCKDVTTLLQCENGAVVEVNCQDQGADYYCKFDGAQEKYYCAQGCVPQCKWDDGTPKECGYDGCYGKCGKCPAGWECKAGMCNPKPGGDCGWITDFGHCDTEANILWFCNNGTLYIDDCTAAGMTCKYAGQGKYKCL